MTLRTLLVADDPDIRAIVALALGQHPKFAVSAVSRLDAAAMIRSGDDEFDAIVLDMKMNDMSAGALIATMRQWARENTPILLLSAKAGDADRRQYRSAGAQGVIAKPFDPVALPDRVIEMLEPVGPIERKRIAGAARG